MSGRAHVRPPLSRPPRVAARLGPPALLTADQPAPGSPSFTRLEAC